MLVATSSASSVPVSLSSPHTCEPGNPGQNQYSCRWDASGALKIVHVFELHKVEIIFRPVTGSQLAVTLQLRSHSSLTFFIPQHQSRHAAYWKWLALQNKKGLACKTSNYLVIKLCWLGPSRWCPLSLWQKLFMQLHNTHAYFLSMASCKREYSAYRRDHKFTAIISKLRPSSCI